MSQSNHTPFLRALQPPEGTMQRTKIYGPPHKDGGEFAALCELNDPEIARLMVAAYNAFDSAAKNLGLHAVEMAERMQAGGISDLAQALAAAHTSLRTFRNVPAADQQWTSLDDDKITAVEWAIAKVEGGVE